MLTEQSSDTISLSIDSLPLGTQGFLIFHDGRTLLVTGKILLSFKFIFLIIDLESIK